MDMGAKPDFGVLNGDLSTSSTMAENTKVQPRNKGHVLIFLYKLRPPIATSDQVSPPTPTIITLKAVAFIRGRDRCLWKRQS